VSVVDRANMMKSRFDEKLRMVVLLSAATLLTACETVPLATGAAQVRFARATSDVASCTAVGNVDAECSPEGQQRTFDRTIRNRTVSLGGNTLLVTNEWNGMVCEGIAYDCH
jgi:hypothetical protein